MTSAQYLDIAFLLAKKADFTEIRPNPFVGAIVVDNNGKIIGEGYHKKAGEAHAEVFAIHAALEKCKDLSTCTLYVTLEPCSHFGKTPPCTELILQSGISKVVIGSLDPNPLVSGAQFLKEKGVQVEICIIPAIVELNSTFNINHQFKRPKYIVKIATTINGKIADRNGDSQWLSNKESRQYVHKELRAKTDAILTTAKTIIKDNATLNIRIDGQFDKELNLIVIDQYLDLLKEEHNSLSIFYPRKNSNIYLVSPLSYEKPLPKQVKILKTKFNNAQCVFDDLNRFLLNENICNVLVEAGGRLNGSLIKEKIVDEIFTFVTPSILNDNSAINMLNLDQPHLMNEKIKLQLTHCQNFGDDILAKYKVLY